MILTVKWNEERCKEIQLGYMTNFKEEKLVQTFQFSLCRTQRLRRALVPWHHLWGHAAAGGPRWMHISRQPSRPEEGLLLLWKLGWPVMALADRAWMEVMPLWSTTCFQEDWQLPPWSLGLSLSVGHPAALLKAPSRDALKLASRRQPWLNSWPSELWNTMKWLLFKASEFGERLLCCTA